MTANDGPSGLSGLLGRIVDWFDRLPVGGSTIAGTIVGFVVLVGSVVVSFLSGGLGNTDCQKDPLQGVYLHQRLRVVDTCQYITGTVVAWRYEHDGDYHVNMRIDESGWTNLFNDQRQHGLTVVEFIPLLPRPKASFFAGQRLRMLGTKVEDLQHGTIVDGEKHGWIELHPVFEVQDVTPAAVTPGPNRPALAPPTED
jgi:hypothetical protein